MFEEEKVQCVKWTMSTTLKTWNKRTKRDTGLGRWSQRIGAVSFPYRSKHTRLHTPIHTSKLLSIVCQERPCWWQQLLCAQYQDGFFLMDWHSSWCDIHWQGQMWHLTGWAGRGVMTAANSADIRAASLGQCHTWPFTRTWPHLPLSFTAGPPWWISTLAFVISTAEAENQ